MGLPVSLVLLRPRSLAEELAFADGETWQLLGADERSRYEALADCATAWLGGDPRYPGRRRGGDVVLAPPQEERVSSALPRGRCPDCRGDVALRKGGLVREHRIYRAQAEQDPTTHLARTRLCPGSGKKALAR
jgi:hypothetical protein